MLLCLRVFIYLFCKAFSYRVVRALFINLKSSDLLKPVCFSKDGNATQFVLFIELFLVTQVHTKHKLSSFITCCTTFLRTPHSCCLTTLSLHPHRLEPSLSFPVVTVVVVVDIRCVQDFPKHTQSLYQSLTFLVNVGCFLRFRPPKADHISVISCWLVISAVDEKSVRQKLKVRRWSSAGIVSVTKAIVTRLLLMEPKSVTVVWLFTCCCPLFLKIICRLLFPSCCHSVIEPVC